MCCCVERLKSRVVEHSGEAYDTCGEAYNTCGEAYNTCGETYNTFGETYNTCGEAYNTCGEAYNHEHVLETHPTEMCWTNVSITVIVIVFCLQ